MLTKAVCLMLTQLFEIHMKASLTDRVSNILTHICSKDVHMHITTFSCNNHDKHQHSGLQYKHNNIPSWKCRRMHTHHYHHTCNSIGTSLVPSKYVPISTLSCRIIAEQQLNKKLKPSASPQLFIQFLFCKNPKAKVTNVLRTFMTNVPLMKPS